MPYLVKHLIEGQAPPVTVGPTELATTALSKMTAGDYSQLPVVDGSNRAIGMVSSDSILKTSQMFKVDAAVLTVRDCLTPSIQCDPEDDVSVVLGSLQTTSAVIVSKNGEEVVGIVTDFDTTQYFKKKAESAMMVQEIEGFLKEFIRFPFSNKSGQELADAIASSTRPNQDQGRFKSAVCKYLQEASLDHKPNLEALSSAFQVLTETKTKKKKLDDLDFKELTIMFLSSDRWEQYRRVVSINQADIDRMLNDVREIRNVIAHFKRELTPDELDLLRRALQWLKNLRPDLERHFSESQDEILAEIEGQTEAIDKAKQEAIAETDEDISTSLSSGTEGQAATPADAKSLSDAVKEERNEQRHFELSKALKVSALGRWLRGVPEDREYTWTSFSKIEELIGVKLPESALEHRSWWANDWSDDSPARLWLEHDWEVEFVNLEREQVRFRRGLF